MSQTPGMGSSREDRPPSESTHFRPATAPLGTVVQETVLNPEGRRRSNSDSSHSFVFDADGPIISRDGDINDFISAGWDAQADRLVIPVSRLSPDFFRLSTGLAGAVLQKCTNYNFRVAIVGDISAYTEKSGPLRDFVYESNKRGDVRFVDSVGDL